MAQKSDNILIVGAGCFGLSTAYHLLKDGFEDVTVIDRAETVPAPDASSNDFNRIVRSAYADPFYSAFAKEAIATWRHRGEWGDIYQESGVVVVGECDYVDDAYKNEKESGCRVEWLKNEPLTKAFPASLVDSGKATLPTDHGYITLDSGWAHAANGVRRMYEKVVALGGKVLTNKAVSTLKKGAEGRTTGVTCQDGSSFDNLDLVILSTGAWTASTFPELNLGRLLLATGQCVAMVELTEEEAKEYATIPVIVDFQSGFYIFPPSAERLVKMAIHDEGYLNLLRGTISTPRTAVTDPDDGLLIPKTMVTQLRARFAEIFPELAKKPFVRTRLCWYTDSPDDNWVIGRHPEDEGILLATAGSGHAYKFLPVLGSLVLKAVKKTLEPELVEKFAIGRKATHPEGTRPKTEIELKKQLKLEELCTPEDLKAGLV